MKKFALILIAIFALAFVGCEDKDDPPNTDPVHIGTIGGIPVYRAYDIAPANGATALANINLAQTALSNIGGQTHKFAQLSKIYVVTGGSVFLGENMVLYVGVNASANDIAEAIVLNIS